MRSWIAFGAVAAYFTLVLVFRMAVHRAKTGSTGLAPQAMSFTEVVVGGLLILGGALMISAPFEEPLMFAPQRATDVIAAAILIFGTAGTWWSQSAMGASWRIGVDASARTALVTGGPFRFVRNPIFTFMLATAAGLFLLVPNLLSLAGAIAMFIGVELQVRFVEEPYLYEAHGDAYRAYTNTTGRFFPGLR